MTYKINKLYLVVHYVESHVLGGQCRVKAELVLYLVVQYAESHVLGGQCCVKAELMLSTSIIA